MQRDGESMADERASSSAAPYRADQLRQTPSLPCCSACRSRMVLPAFRALLVAPAEVECPPAPLLCCWEPGDSSGVPAGGMSRDKRCFLPSLSPAKNEADAAAAPQWMQLVAGGAPRAFLDAVRFLFFWLAAFTTLDLWLLFCVTLAVRPQLGFSPAPLNFLVITVKKYLHLEVTGAAEEQWE